jgi:hypothetical protein
MTILQLRSGGLLIHNAIQLKDEDYAKLESLGKIEYIIAPNALHDSDAPIYKLRYPKAKLYVSMGALKRVKQKCDVDGVLPGVFGQNLRDEVDCAEFIGTRNLHESVFYHSASRTLVVTDLVFNLQVETTGFQKRWLRWNKIDHRFGPSRFFRWFAIVDKVRAEQSLTQILLWNFDRVIMNHGEILEKNGKEAMIRGFKEIGLVPRGY